MTYGSLFAGIGGLDLGLDRAGMRCLWQVERDDYARRVLEKHWPDVPRYADVRTFARWEHGDGYRHIRVPIPDLVCGGFPCQDISLAGMGAGLAGSRSGLWFEMLRIIRALGPRWVLLENVSALRNRGLDAILGGLAASGYDAEWDCIPAVAAGAPHRRDRIFVVARRHTERGITPDAGGQRSQGPRTTVPAWDGRWGSAPPPICRVDDGIPRRVDRLRVLGNAVVPQVAEWIGRRILAADSQK